MNTKIFNNARFTPKGDIEANWNKAVGFIPLKKEIIVYLPDSTHTAARIKIGDGVTNVNDLPFIGSSDGDVASKEWVTEYGMELSEMLKQYADTKYDQDGGIISGDVAIQGNLSVSGTTTTKDTETLQVKDNVIVANVDGVEIIEDSGFAIKTSTTDAYGIMYDPVGDGVKIGLGSFDENGKFIYEEGQAQFLATRADAIENGHIPKWDDEAKQFVDSGVDYNDYVKNTDKASSSSYGVMRTYHNQWSSGLTFIQDMLAVYAAEKSAIDAKVNTTCPIVPFNIDYAWKVSATTNTEAWTDEERQSARDLIGAVGAGDVTSATKAGLMMVGEGLMASSSGNGKVNVRKAEKTDIDTATNAYKPIVPLMRDYFTMKSLSDCKDETLWTDDSTVDGEVVKGTKTKACETIGAVQKPTSTGLILFNKDTGKISAAPIYQSTPLSGQIPRANSNGNIKTNTPKEPQDCSNKDYVDNLPDYLDLSDEQKAKWKAWIESTGIGKFYIHSFYYEDDEGEYEFNFVNTRSTKYETYIEHFEAEELNHNVLRAFVVDCGNGNISVLQSYDFSLGINDDDEDDTCLRAQYYDNYERAFKTKVIYNIQVYTDYTVTELK